MSTQWTDGKGTPTTITTELFAPSKSVSAHIPPELFSNILAYVGDKARLGYHEHGPFSSFDPDARREEMKHLSACALTCVYWAQLTRKRMFRFLVLRSSKNMSGLLSFLRAPQSPRIPPICDIVRWLDAFYTLGDLPWFHNLTGLESRYRISQLEGLNLYITGPATPAFLASSTRGSVLHPLFFATPRVLPVTLSEGCNSTFNIQSIHLPNPTMLFNLLQDCLPLRPRRINCTNLTWDPDPAIQNTPSSIGLKYACRMEDRYWNDISGCTDDILVAAMVESVPHHEFSLRRRGPHLNPLETSYLFDAMRTTWCGLQLERQRTERFEISSNSGPHAIQEDAAMRLPTGTDFCLEWWLDLFVFKCMASRLPHAPATSNNVRNITYIIIDLCLFADHHKLRRRMKEATINWDTFLPTVRQFPHFRQILIQWTSSLKFPHHQLVTKHNGSLNVSPRQILVDFIAHLGGAWFGLGELLGLYYRGWGEPEWVQLRLDTLMDEIKQAREEIKAEDDAEKGASSELESSVIEREPSTASADVQAQTSSAAASQDSRETSKLADGEVEILPEHIALLDEARQCQIEVTELETTTNKAALSELDSSVVVEEGSTEATASHLVS